MKHIAKRGKKKGKPPGRPWHTSVPSKVCLICLRRYFPVEREPTPEPESEDEHDNRCEEVKTAEVIVIDISDEDKEDNNGQMEQDPLLDLIAKTNCSSKTAVAVGEDTISSSVPASSDKEKKEKIAKKKEKPLKRKRDNVYFRFLKITSRYLQIKTKRFRNSAKENSMDPPFCEACYDSIRRFCDIYSEWEKAKISLKWSLSQISSKVKISNSKISCKLGNTLFKSLSTQLQLFSSRAVELFRKQLAWKGSIQSKDLFDVPKVSVDRSICKKYVESKLKFPIDHMVGYLKSLIVIFALAIPPKEEDSSDEISLSSRSKKARSLLKLKGEHSEQQGDENYSPPASPAGSYGDCGDNERQDGGDEHVRGSDSDWSANAIASGNDSDVEFAVDPSLPRRWNLRKRRSRRINNDDGKENEGEDDIAAELPPLRRSKGLGRRVATDAEKKIPCNICNLKFAGESGLKRHISQMHHFILPYDCNRCGKRFKKKLLLDLHRKKEHPPTHLHSKQHSLKPIAATCKVCQKVFPSKTKLRIHKLQTHKEESESFTCEECGKVIKYRFRFEFHMKKHERNPFHCTFPNCERRFMSESVMQQHLIFHEKNPEWTPATKRRGRQPSEAKREGSFKCEAAGCRKSFLSKNHLKIHETLHASSFTCNECNREFSHFKELRSHLVKTHETSEKVYFCCCCDRGYTMMQTYELHLITFHVTSTKYSCDVVTCTEEFKGPDELRTHLKTEHLPADVVEIVEKPETLGIFGIPANKIEQSAISSSPNKTENSCAALENPPFSPKKPDLAETVLEPLLPTPNPGDSNPNPDLEVPETALATAITEKTEQAIVTTEAPVSTKSEEKGEGEIVSEEKEIKKDVKKEGQKDPEQEDYMALGLYTCERCKWSFTTRFALSLHFIMHTQKDDQGLFHCERCIKAFPVVSSLRTHYNTEHGPNIKLLVCLLCGTKFHRMESYTYHLKQHKEDSAESFMCSECGENCGNRVAYRKHMRTHMSTRGSKTKIKVDGDDKETDGSKISRHEGVFKCNQCEQTFLQKVVLVNHLFNAHGQEKPYKCDEEGCGKSFCSSYNLRVHKIIHGEATLQCPHCPRSFRRKNNLEDHLLVHKEEKNFICDICGKAFYKRNTLRIHIEAHIKGQQYQCAYCDKAFTYKPQLKSHERTHTGEKPYPCRFCGKPFSAYSSRKIHEDRHKKENSQVAGETKSEDVKQEVLEKPATRKRNVRSRTTRTRKRKGKNNTSATSSNEAEAEDGGENSEDDVKVNVESEGTTSASGIIHEALKAAFNDGVDTDMPELQPEVQPEHSRQDFMNSIEVFVQYNDSKQEDKHVVTVENTEPVKRRGRPPKKKMEMEKTTNSKQMKKNLSCGFCGKEFKREKLLNEHVESHLTLDAILSNTSSERSETRNVESQKGERRQSFGEQGEMTSTLSLEHLKAASFDQSTITAAGRMMRVPSTSADRKQIIPETPVKKGRGRPPKNGNQTVKESPGSRLARIVEDVLGANSLTNSARGGATPPQTRASSQAQSSQNYHFTRSSVNPQNTVQLPHSHSSSPQQFLSHSQSPHHQFQSPSPHHMTHSESERSTPNMAQSPVPTTTHHHNQTQVTTATAATSSSSPLFNPFLFSNPYLLPRQDYSSQSQQTASQQSPAFQLHQQGLTITPYTQQQLSANANGNMNAHLNQTMNYQQLSHGQASSPNTLPQDLSKSSYPMFFANPR